MVLRFVASCNDEHHYADRYAVKVPSAVEVFTTALYKCSFTYLLT